MEKLVDVVHFMHFEIHEAFGSADGDEPATGTYQQRLGAAGLALHYANIINQIDTLVSRSGSLPPSMRDSLYQNLPPSIKSALRCKLQEFQLDEELTAQQIKAEMEKTLQWLVPIANNTTKAHHGFGWVGEWASTGAEMVSKLSGHTNLLRIETLYHAEKETTESYILDLIVSLHNFFNASRQGKNFIGPRSPIKSPNRYSSQDMSSAVLLSYKPNSAISSTPLLTREDKELLRLVDLRKRTLRVSKSQDFDAGRPKLIKQNRLCKSSSNSPTKEFKCEMRKLSFPVIDFDINRIKALDVIDRVDSLRNL
ncbi:hypothetical protein HPP92_018811 [Vanilla planifolia]|uniref:DUF668 domain-containing protein n=1 Tax=Vanilla planifolia TaxID=51239 RepID=A0A835UK58_VANPL|nr:hypothetical protein HPP92_018811 [Vanilla planifolia]